MRDEQTAYWKSTYKTVGSAAIDPRSPHLAQFGSLIADNYGLHNRSMSRGNLLNRQCMRRNGHKTTPGQIFIP